MKNATYKFLEPSRAFHSSESRWTAMAQIALIWLSGSKNKHLQIYNSGNAGLIVTDRFLQMNGWTCDNTIVEGRLNGDLFNDTKWPNDFLNLSPDIIRIDTGPNVVKIIEVKTVGASVKPNAKLYQRLNEYIKSLGWQSELYYLLSHGHENGSDWPYLQVVGADILIWEDLFLLMADGPIANLIGTTIGNYCERPRLQG